MRPRPRLLIPFMCAVVATGALLPATGGQAAASTATAKPVVAGSRYLALGDSVTFGYRESTNLPTPDYSDAANFRGYPEVLASTLGLRLANAACPGETASSLIDKHAQSNGCENAWAAGAPLATGYRTLHPLHRTYAGSQLHFAERYLTNHPGTRLVTLTVGANDAFLCVRQTSDGCVSEFGALLTTLQENLATILGGLRDAGYAGQLALVNYYSLDYSNALLTGQVRLLNNALATAAAPYHVKIVSAFDAFSQAAAQAGGDTCAAQLVTVLSDGTCGVHPSVAGAAVLAQAVAQRIRK